MHNFLALDGPAVAHPSLAPPLPGPSGAPAQDPGVNTPGALLFEDDFESGTLSRWTKLLIGPGSTAGVDTAAGRYGQAAARISAGPEKGAFAAARVVLKSPQGTLAVGLDVKVHLEGPIGANVPLLRLFDSTGKRLLTVYRQNLADGRLWVGVGGDHVASQGKLDLDTWAHLAVEVHPNGREAGSVVTLRLDGRLVAQVQAAELVKPTSIIQIGNDSKNQPFDLYVDDVRVTR
jgi:hypothetical protein